MASSVNTQEIISEHAARLANDYALQEVDVIRKHGTQVFVSNGGLDGHKLSLTMRMDYSAMPEVYEQLRRIATRALNESIQAHIHLLIEDELGEIEV